MLKTVTMVAALLAAVFTALLGMPAALILGRVKALCPADPTPMPADAEQDRRRTAPLLGGLVLWPAVAAAFVSAWLLAHESLAANGYTGGWRTAATLLGCAAGFGLIGLADDCVRVARKGRGMALWLRLVLQLAVTGLFFAQLQMNGTLTTQFWVPGLGWPELGLWYYAAGAALVLLVVNSAGTVRDADGLGAGTGFVAALTMLILAILLLELDVPGDRFVTGLAAAALAGGCVGFLFWDFPPSRLRLGGAGSMFLAGALLAMAWGLGRPLLLVPVALPVLWNGVAGLVLHFIRRDGAPVGFHSFLRSRGWSNAAIVPLYCGLGCLGGLAAILFVFG